MHWRGTTWIWVLFVLLLAFAIRSVAAVTWQSRLTDSSTFALPDSATYWELARTIANGEPYQYGSSESRVFRTPGYPAILSILFSWRTDPPVVWARLVGALLGTLTVAVTMLLARLLFNHRVALLTGWLATFYPGGIGLSILVLSEAPFCPLMMGQLVFWVLAWKASSLSRQITWSGLAGGMAGLATLMRPSWLLFTPFCLLLFILVKRERRRHIVIAGSMLASLCLAMTPWWIRNYRVTGTTVLTTLQVGASLYDGLNPEATGASDMSFTRTIYWDLKAQPAVEQGLFEVRLDQHYRELVWKWVWQEPGRAASLAGVKLLRMWNIWPNSAEIGSVWIYRLMTLAYLPLLILSCVGAWKFARLDHPTIICLLPAFYLTGLHVIFVSSIRYRQPAMLVLIVLAAAVTAGLMDRQLTGSTLAQIRLKR